MDSTHKTSGIIIGVVLLVVGLAGGYGIAKAADTSPNATSTTTTSTSSKAADLRADLVTLGVEHMSLTDQAVAAALDGAPNAEATGKALYANGNAIGAAVGSVYGKDAETTFDKVWKLHLDEFVKYAVAAKSGDESGKQTALDTISSEYTKPLAQYLAKANPNLPEDVLEASLSDHVAMTAKMIDYHVAGNYAQEADELTMANKHLEGLMSTLAGAIVKQYPQKFQG